MKKIYAIVSLVILTALLSASTALVAQTYNVGQVITFDDGSKGVVCYVNPQNEKQGWAIALTDLDHNMHFVRTTTIRCGRNSKVVGQRLIYRGLGLTSLRLLAKTTPRFYENMGSHLRLRQWIFITAGIFRISIS